MKFTYTNVCIYKYCSRGPDLRERTNNLLLKRVSLNQTRAFCEHLAFEMDVEQEEERCRKSIRRNGESKEITWVSWKKSDGKGLDNGHNITEAKICCVCKKTGKDGSQDERAKVYIILITISYVRHVMHWRRYRNVMMHLFLNSRSRHNDFSRLLSFSGGPSLKWILCV